MHTNHTIHDALVSISKQVEALVREVFKFVGNKQGQAIADSVTRIDDDKAEVVTLSFSTRYQRASSIIASVAEKKFIFYAWKLSKEY